MKNLNFPNKAVITIMILGLLFSILAAGAVDGDASLTTLSILAVAGIGFMSLGTYMMNKEDDQDSF